MRRVRKVVTNTDGYDGTYYFVWNADWQLMETYVWNEEEGGPLLSHAVVNAGSPTPWYAAMGVQPSALPYIDDHVALIKRNGDYYFYHTDAQFNTLAITDAAGSLAATYVESPYGVLESFTVAGGSGLGSLATNNALLHQGLMYDVESGTYYNRWRQYLPRLGRFGQRDRVAYAWSTNLFQYLTVRPTTLHDPLGLHEVGGSDDPHRPQFGSYIGNCTSVAEHWAAISRPHFEGDLLLDVFFVAHCFTDWVIEKQEPEDPKSEGPDNPQEPEDPEPEPPKQTPQCTAALIAAQQTCSGVIGMGPGSPFNTWYQFNQIPKTGSPWGAWGPDHPPSWFCDSIEEDIGRNDSCLQAARDAQALCSGPGNESGLDASNALVNAGNSNDFLLRDALSRCRKGVIDH